MLAKSTRDDFIFRFDTRDEGGFRDVGWEILPECPRCGEDITHSDTKEVRVIEHVGINEIETDPNPFKIETEGYTTHAGVVYPCEHMFEDTRELFFYLMRHQGLADDIETIQRIGMDPAPIEVELSRRRDKIMESALI